MKTRILIYCFSFILAGCSDTNKTIMITKDSTGTLVAVMSPSSDTATRITASFKLHRTGLPIHNVNLILNKKAFKSGVEGSMLMGIVPGTYLISAAHPGYRAMSDRELKIAEGERCKLTIYLIPK